LKNQTRGTFAGINDEYWWAIPGGEKPAIRGFLADGVERSLDSGFVLVTTAQLDSTTFNVAGPKQHLCHGASGAPVWKRAPHGV
jgi:hypothetical protein